MSAHTEALTDAAIDVHLDAILRASGSALRHYSMHKTISDMRAALRSAVAALSLPDPLQALADTHAALGLTYENTTPSRSKRMAEAGFTQRDTRLTCDECGKKYTPQMLPIHGCQPDPSAAPVVPQWQRMDQGTPLDGQRCAVIAPGALEGDLWPTKWDAANQSFSAAFGWFEADEVTHWMPLPPAPQQGEQG